MHDPSSSGSGLVVELAKVAGNDGTAAVKAIVVARIEVGWVKVSVTVLAYVDLTVTRYVLDADMDDAAIASIDGTLEKQQAKLLELQCVSS